ncbi:MAG: lipoyl synthase [Candidatus Zixiibacteriota bacterium]
MNITKRKPSWFKQNIKSTEIGNKVRSLLEKHHLNTVCEEAKCPNRNNCYSNGNATFLIMGDICTRNCRFCAIESRSPRRLDHKEPEKIASVVKDLELSYVVLTSVTRDDLKDGGANHFFKTIESIKNSSPNCKIEVLIPDMQGNTDNLGRVIEASPDVINHNIETIGRLYEDIRPQASYKRSLELLKYTAQKTNILTKSGFMLGLGEKEKEVYQLLDDLKQNDVKMVTIGQYLAPSEMHYPIRAFIDPERFAEYEKYAYSKGFLAVFSGPLVRSSYLADQMYEKAIMNSS